jgi:hypothetical protein
VVRFRANILKRILRKPALLPGDPDAAQGQGADEDPERDRRDRHDGGEDVLGDELRVVWCEKQAGPPIDEHRSDI